MMIAFASDDDETERDDDCDVLDIFLGGAQKWMMVMM